MQLHFRLNDCSGGTATVTTLSSVNTTETCATTMAVKIVGSSPTSNHYALYLFGARRSNSILQPDKGKGLATERDGTGSL